MKNCSRSLTLSRSSNALRATSDANTGQPARAGGRAQGVRAARPGQRARAVLHLVALLPRRGAGVGQGAGAGALLDGHLSARGVRVQQPRQRADPLRPVRAGGAGAARGDPARSEVHPGLLQPRGLAAGAQPPARGARRSCGRRPTASSSSSARGACRTCWRSSRATRDDGARAGRVGRRARDQRGVRLAGARAGVRRARQRGARAVPPRHRSRRGRETSRRSRRS